MTTPIVTTTTLPPYISPSPLGFHTTDLTAFTTAHPLPLSTDPDRQAFASPDVYQLLTSQFPPDAAGKAMAKLMIYNKTHSTDRICPSCRRVYRVGEPPRPWQGTFTAWLARPSAAGQGWGGYAEEQELSGICSELCFQVLTEIEARGWSEERINEWANQDVRALMGVPLDVGLDGWRVRRTTVREQAVDGVKIVWERSSGRRGLWVGKEGGGGRFLRWTRMVGLGLGDYASYLPYRGGYSADQRARKGYFFASLVRSR